MNSFYVDILISIFESIGYFTESIIIVIDIHATHGAIDKSNAVLTIAVLGRGQVYCTLIILIRSLCLIRESDA